MREGRAKHERESYGIHERERAKHKRVLSMREREPSTRES